MAAINRAATSGEREKTVRIYGNAVKVIKIQSRRSRLGIGKGSAVMHSLGFSASRSIEFSCASVTQMLMISFDCEFRLAAHPTTARKNKREREADDAASKYVNLTVCISLCPFLRSFMTLTPRSHQECLLFSAIAEPRMRGMERRNANCAENWKQRYLFPQFIA